VTAGFLVGFAIDRHHFPRPHYCAYRLAIQRQDLASSIAAIVGARRPRPALLPSRPAGLPTRRELITGAGINHVVSWPWPWLCEPVKTVMLPCYRSGGRARISIGAFLFELLRFHLLSFASKNFSSICRAAGPACGSKRSSASSRPLEL
jgi:hypothetical protein